MSGEDVQEEVVELETQQKQQEDGKARSEAAARPVKGWLGLLVPSREDRRPRPPGALEDDNKPKGKAGSPFQRDALPVEEVLCWSASCE